MSYRRVLPRDLFNEAKLLKCIGVVVLAIMDRKVAGLKMDDSKCAYGFKVDQDPSDGSFMVSNLTFTALNGELVHFRSPLNSRLSYPLMVTFHNEDYRVLNEDGEWALAPDLFLRSP